MQKEYLCRTYNKQKYNTNEFYIDSNTNNAMFKTCFYIRMRTLFSDLLFVNVC